MLRLISSTLALGCLLLPVTVQAQEDLQGFLDTRAIAGEAFRKSNPAWDGRGVAIAVLDTGVDMGVPGLEKTTTGSVKVVEARDFTDESVVECEKPEAGTDEEGRRTWRAKGGWVRGIDSIVGLPEGGAVCLGFLDESRFKNSSVPDLNSNGRTDDRFALVLFKGDDGEWRVVLDRDGDKDLAGEPVIRSYDRGREHVVLGDGNPGKASNRVSVAAHIDAGSGDPKKVELHVVAGSHGTHVAGIAAGHRLNAREDRDGVAPGAVVLSLKIGNNSLAGGATVTGSMKKALEFAARWGRDQGMPVVANISYGVGSEIEGHGDIDRFIDSFCKANPHVLVVTSAGNAGPGLSTVGTPAAASAALTVGAAYTAENARELLGADLKGTRIFQFSSRGGEVAKPDVAAPGIAASAVPYWSPSDLMRGTSMAAPVVSGAAALVLSAALDAPGFENWNSGMLKRALRSTARPLSGYTWLDQGAGIVDVVAALPAFRKSLNDPVAVSVLDLSVATATSTFPDRKTGASFWRAGGWAPGGEDPAEVQVRAVFLDRTSSREKADSYVTLALSSSAPWLRLSKGRIYLRGEQQATFDIRVDRTRLREPGVHVALVRGRGPGTLDMVFPVTVVIPEPVAMVDGIPTLRRDRIRVPPGEIVRLPFALPPGTRTLGLAIEPAGNAMASVHPYLFDSRGRRVDLSGGWVSSEQGLRIKTILAGEEILDPGTHELVLFAPPNARSDSVVKVDLRFFAMSGDPVRSLSMDPGRPPSARTQVVNDMQVPFIGAVGGRIQGVERDIRRHMEVDFLKEGFRVAKEIEAVEFMLELSEEDYNRFTDVAVNVVDRSGKALVKTGFGNRIVRFEFRNPNPGAQEGSYTLEIHGGRAGSGGPRVEVRIRTRWRWKEPVALVGTVGDARLARLAPTVRTPLDLKASSMLISAPKGTRWYGHVDFQDRKSGETWLRLPVSVAP